MDSIMICGSSDLQITRPGLPSVTKTTVWVGKIQQIPLDLARSQEPASTLSEGRRPESTYTRAEGPSDRDARALQN